MTSKANIVVAEIVDTPARSLNSEMVMSLAPSPGYSAAVAIRLEQNGAAIPVAQVGETSLVLAANSAVPSLADAKLIVTVDEEEFPYDIQICAVNGRRVSFQ